MDTDRPDVTTIRAALDLARRAPSLHNSQPWRFVLDPSATLRLLTDDRRAVRTADPDGRQTLIGNGAILDHLQMVADALGWHTRPTTFPDPNHPGVLATVEFDPAPLVTDGHRSRVDAIARRVSHRLPMGAPVDCDLLLPVVEDLFRDPDVHLVPMTGDLLSALRRASRMATLERAYDWRYHAELAWWTSAAPDEGGIPLDSLPTTAERDMVEIAREFPSSPRLVHSAPRTDDAQVVALCTPEDERRDHLACGRALSTVLVEATAWGLATCAVSHLTEMPSSRAVITEAIGDGWAPQILVRIGTADETVLLPRTPRRPVDDILTDLTPTSRGSSTEH